MLGSNIDIAVLMVVHLNHNNPKDWKLRLAKHGHCSAMVGGTQGTRRGSMWMIRIWVSYILFGGWAGYGG